MLQTFSGNLVFVRYKGALESDSCQQILARC